MLKNNRKFQILTVLMLTLSLMLTVGCFGKKGNSETAAVVVAPPSASTGNIVPGSVNVARSADGAVTVNWKTTAPSKTAGVLSGNLFFNDRPLYSASALENSAVPKTEHQVILNDLPKNEKVAIAVIDGTQDISDNSGLGYVLK